MEDPLNLSPFSRSPSGILRGVGRDFGFIRQAVVEEDIAVRALVVAALRRHALGAEKHDIAAFAIDVGRDRMFGEGIGPGDNSRHDVVRHRNARQSVDELDDRRVGD